MNASWKTSPWVLVVVTLALALLTLGVRLATGL